MCQLIESIKVSSNQLHNLSYHQRRMQGSAKELFSTPTHCVNFDEIQIAALNLKNKVNYKLKVIYDKDDFEYNFAPYEIRMINSLKIIDDAELDYHLKYKDRDDLWNHFEKRGEQDDILITQNGSVTDTYYCNVAFKKNGQWFTPDMPLLKGTKRQNLIDRLIITEKEIFIEDIPDYNEICLFNAMIDFGTIKFPVTNILID